MEDKEEEAERKQQQRQRWRKSQVQQEEAALEGHGAAGEPAGGEAPQKGVQAMEVQEDWGEWVGSCEGQVGEVAGTRGGPQAHGWRRAYSHPPSLSHHSGLNSLAGLAVWRQH